MKLLEQAVADILIKATQAAEAAGRFATEQLPDIARQYVLFVGIWNSVIVLGTVVFVGFAVWLTRLQLAWIGKHKRTGYLDDNDRYFTLIPTALGWVTLILISLTHVTHSGRLVVLAFFAPKILLIEWAASLVK